MRSPLTRRRVLIGLPASLALPSLARAAAVDAATDFGVAAGTLDDQSAALQAALDAAVND